MMGPGLKIHTIPPRRLQSARSGMRGRTIKESMPRRGQFWARMPLSMPNNTGGGGRLNSSTFLLILILSKKLQWYQVSLAA